MSFLNKVKAAVNRMMAGRHGADELSMAMMILGLLLSIVDGFVHTGLLSIVSMALYVLAVVRMFSRDHNKRFAENQKYLTFGRNAVNETKQFFVRLKNIRKYKYFKCPECHARLRLPRKVGEVTVTCGKCRHAFRQKA